MAEAEPEREPERGADAMARIGTDRCHVDLQAGRHALAADEPADHDDRADPTGEQPSPVRRRPNPLPDGFDHLVLATGAVPVRPPLPGCDIGVGDG